MLSFLPLAFSALDRADCTVDADMVKADELYPQWKLDSSALSRLKEQVKSNLFVPDPTDINRPSSTKMTEWLKDYIFRDYLRRSENSSSSSYFLRIPEREFIFKKPSDGYYAFKSAKVGFTGKVYVCKSENVIVFRVEMDIEFYDLYVFASVHNYYGANYVLRPTSIGNRLERAGYIRPFEVRETWRIEETYEIPY